MSPIADLNTYLTHMDASLLDKCWWVDKIPNEEIETIIDFGCAAGHLKSMIDYLIPNKFRYIGIDNSLEMRKECQDKGIEVYATIDEIIELINPKTTVLVLNSVIHEILTYLKSDSAIDLLQKLGSYKFRYIAIRDMDLYYSNYDNPYEIVEIFKHFPYANQWEYVFRNSYLGINATIKEFLLKYWYIENWEREKDEHYLWNIVAVANDFDKYTLRYEDHFYIPYVRDKIIKDFGIISDEYTHVKLLLEYGTEDTDNADNY